MLMMMKIPLTFLDDDDDDDDDDDEAAIKQKATKFVLLLYD